VLIAAARGWPAQGSASVGSSLAGLRGLVSRVASLASSLPAAPGTSGPGFAHDLGLSEDPCDEVEAGDGAELDLTPTSV
jgi:hypothetical protein